jgi:ribosome-binding protein aMBF1 (putative translation factor)
MSSGGTLYAIASEGTALVKIGCTTGTVEKRLKSLQTGQPFSLHVLASVPVEADVQRIEKQVHAFLAQERRRGEWFEISLDAAALAALVVRAVQFVKQADERRSTPAPGCAGNFGQAVRKARIDKGWSQQALSARTGIAQKHLSALENDQMMPKWPTLATLAMTLDLDLNRLAREWSHLMIDGSKVIRQ